MKLNEGSFDRILRIIIAIIVAVLFFTDTIGGTLGIVLLVAAGIMLITGLVGFCPAYTLFKINTRTKK